VGIVAISSRNVAQGLCFLTYKVRADVGDFPGMSLRKHVVVITKMIDQPMTRAISVVTELFVVLILDGSMEDLDGKWILAKDTACPEKDASPATLGLPNMAGLHFDNTT